MCFTTLVGSWTYLKTLGLGAIFIGDNVYLVFRADNFKCPENMTHHLKKVFEGEYDIPVNTTKSVPGMRILDVGANCGAFTLWAYHRWPLCKIESYEPHPESFKLLKENTDTLWCVGKHNVAVGNPGVKILYNGVNNLGEATLKEASGGASFTGQHVNVISPLEMPIADILKMDTEGCEVEILEPLIDAGREFRAVMFEYHSINDRRKLDRLLMDYVLIGSEVYTPGRGVMKYVHRSEIK